MNITKQHPKELDNPIFVVDPAHPHKFIKYIPTHSILDLLEDLIRHTRKYTEEIGITWDHLEANEQDKKEYGPVLFVNQENYNKIGLEYLWVDDMKYYVRIADRTDIGIGITSYLTATWYIIGNPNKLGQIRRLLENETL